MLDDDVIVECLQTLEQGRLTTIGLVMDPRQALFLYTVFANIEYQHERIGHKGASTMEVSKMREALEEILTKGGMSPGQFLRLSLLMQSPP